MNSSLSLNWTGDSSYIVFVIVLGTRAQRMKKLYTEELLERKRETQRYERIKNKSKKRKELSEKKHLKYLKKKEKGN